MAKWVAPLVVGGLIGFAASDESRRMRRAGLKATKDRVSKCVSGKVRGEGWNQRQAVAACLSMQEQRRLRADGSYIRKGQRADKRFAPGETLLLDSPHSRGLLPPSKVNFRGYLGKDEAVVVQNGRQMAVKLAWLSPVKGQRAKHSKRDFVKQVWERQAPTMAGGPLPPPIPGMEGPFRYRSGRVLYWDPKEGAYYDRGRDMYVAVEEVEFAMSGRRNKGRRNR